MTWKNAGKHARPVRVTPGRRASRLERRRSEKQTAVTVERWHEGRGASAVELLKRVRGLVEKGEDK